jgi:hypothetical protein
MQKHFKSFINELRRAQKVGLAVNKAAEFGHSAARTYLHNLEDQGVDLDLYGVTMTKIPKVGINPRSEYYTPIGVYFYPAKYYLNTVTLPFQHEAPFINIIRIDTKEEHIVFLDNVTNDVVEAAAKILFKDNYKSILRDAKDDARVQTSGGIWWFLSFFAADDNPRRWTSVLRNTLGVKVVIDNAGDGIIHVNEPTQGVILDSTVAKVVRRFENKQYIDVDKNNIDSVWQFVVNKYKQTRKVPKFGEDILATDPVIAYEYSKYILNGPFPKGEESIAKDPVIAYEYSRYILNGPFPKGEESIAKDPETSYNYARYSLNGPFPKGEDGIAKDSLLAYRYSRYVLKGRFPKGEDAIAQDPELAYDYATKILKGRFEQAEKYILQNADYAAMYAFDVLKRPWPEAENVIKKSLYYAKEYEKFKQKFNQQAEN